ncbi:unnamed protein product, partial [Ceratitis capitata]
KPLTYPSFWPAWIHSSESSLPTRRSTPECVPSVRYYAANREIVNVILQKTVIVQDQPMNICTTCIEPSKKGLSSEEIEWERQQLIIPSNCVKYLGIILEKRT